MSVTYKSWSPLYIELRQWELLSSVYLKYELLFKRLCRINNLEELDLNQARMHAPCIAMLNCHAKLSWCADGCGGSPLVVACVRCEAQPPLSPRDPPPRPNRGCIHVCAVRDGHQARVHTRRRTIAAWCSASIECCLPPSQRWPPCAPRHARTHARARTRTHTDKNVFCVRACVRACRGSLLDLCEQETCL
jgi:hypothetical protein